MEASCKVVRSYRLVFRRRWRIFHLQRWRIPLPGGLELRLVAYWLACLGALALLGRLPLVGAALASLPVSARLLAAPLATAWILSRWEPDGRPPHRALLGLAAWRARPRVLAAGRRCPAPGSALAPLGELVLGPELAGARYPRGRLRGPARLLLRYPVQVRAEGRSPNPFGHRGAELAPRWCLRGLGARPLHRGATLVVPAGRAVIFEGHE